MQAMIEHASYMAHGYCLLWQPWLVTLWAGSDLLIFFSYLAIPVALVVFLRRRPDLQHRSLVFLFAAFILLCGLTHILSVVTLWYPIYPFVGVVKLATGLVSAATAITLFRLIPALTAIPSPQHLQEAIGQLQTEALEHTETMNALEKIRGELEIRVRRRTDELEAANELLSVMASEALHRSRNLLGVVVSLARKTADNARDIPSFLEVFTGRIDALATATSAMKPSGQNEYVALQTIVERQLQPVLETYKDRVTINGPEFLLNMVAAQQIALAVHELATNAIKYGALSGASGSIDISWARVEGEEPSLEFHWLEEGGTPVASGSEDKGGFGTQLLTRAVPVLLGGTATRDFTRTGLKYFLTVAVAKITP